MSTSVLTAVSDPAEGGGEQCFHCGLPVPGGSDFAVQIEGQARPMCCAGCQAVASAIVNAGQESFYHHRTGRLATGRELVPEFLRETAVFDNPAVQKSFVTRRQGSVREAHLIIEGITCAACVWLNEQYLQQLAGVLSAQINYATRRALVRWDEDRIQLSEILRAVARIGYQAHPYDPHRQQQIIEAERKQHLRRLGLAGVLGMQVMMIAVVLYSGEWSGMEEPFRRFFHWISLGLTTPVVLYSAQPFFRTAWRDLRRRRVGMDVPVALAVFIAFAASAMVTVTGSGHVYFDSVVMFVFFLLTARYLELVARKRATESLDAVAHAVPASATRISDAGAQEVIPVAELRPGDRVLIRPGETVPADGRVINGRSSVSEALLTGESLPDVRTAGDRLIGGSTNVESTLEMQVRQVGEETVLSGILRLLERAQTEKPSVVRAADRAASWFVGVVLVLAVAVAVGWYLVDATRWLPVTIAVLVVTCPCALSLATPAAITAATGRLARCGLLVTRGHALEALARATHVVFDKTGTLTDGRLSLERTVTYADMTMEQCLRHAAALEQSSEHPIATALLRAVDHLQLPLVEDVTVEAGAGVRGRIGRTGYCIGTPEFLSACSEVDIDANALRALQGDGGTVVLLGSERKLLAGFLLRDSVREDAHALVRALQQQGRQVVLLSGDNEQAVRRVAGEVGINDFAWSRTPRDKLRKVHVLQSGGQVVAMVGDGINDAPVLAQAQISIAMGAGAALAAVNADMVLLSERVSQIADGFRVATRARRIIRQNLGWAVSYNLLALPAAAAGWVAPWAAAIGMSASSLLVVANALRLRKE